MLPYQGLPPGCSTTVLIHVLVWWLVYGLEECLRDFKTSDQHVFGS